MIVLCGLRDILFAQLHKSVDTGLENQTGLLVDHLSTYVTISYIWTKLKILNQTENHSDIYKLSYPESAQIFVERGKVKVMDNHNVSTACAENQLIARGRNPAAHQSTGMKYALRDKALFSLRIDVPSEDAAIEAGAYEQLVLGGVLDVLHPVGVAVEDAQLLLHVPQVPQCHSKVI